MDLRFEVCEALDAPCLRAVEARRSPSQRRSACRADVRHPPLTTVTVHPGRANLGRVRELAMAGANLLFVQTAELGSLPHLDVASASHVTDGAWWALGQLRDSQRCRQQHKTPTRLRALGDFHRPDRSYPSPIRPVPPQNPRAYARARKRKHGGSNRSQPQPRWHTPALNSSYSVPSWRVP
jgi:hypothetical protein